MSQHIYTYDPVNGLEEIGGAGHIIEDADGVTYAKRENLQFEGASVTDDATNNKTVVTITDTNFVGTMAEWNALTTAQKAQYKTVDLTDDFNGEPIDDALSTTSEHTVQNKVVTAAINGKAQTDHASSSATYGLGTAANYGHNKIIDNLTKTSLASGEALSAHMGNSLGKMVATIESSSTASQAYAVGKQFVYNGILYKATSAISAGGTINPGTGGNCTPADSVTTQISNLNSNISDITTELAQKAKVVYKNYDWSATHSFLSTGNHFYLVAVEAGDIAFIRQYSNDGTINYSIFKYASVSTSSPTSISNIRIGDNRIWIDLSVAKGCVVYEL